MVWTAALGVTFIPSPESEHEYSFHGDRFKRLKYAIYTAHICSMSRLMDVQNERTMFSIAQLP